MSGKYISTELLKKQFDPKTLDPLVKEARRKGYSEQDVNEARARAEKIAKIICDGIDLIPAADVEPVVRGEWTMLTADLTDWSRETYVHWLKCSLCGKAVPLRFKSKFCPHCGAHMVERQCAMPFNPQSVEEEKKACADYFERAERSGSGE